MAKRSYPVTRNGIQFEVRAESKEEAQRMAENADLSSVARVIARQGSTRIFQRPNGNRYLVSPNYSTTDPEKVNKALQGMSAAQISSQAIDEDILKQYPFAARAGEFVRGVPFAGSYLDEALSATLGPEAGVGARALSGAMQRQRPAETLGLNIAGGVTGTAGALAAAPQAVSSALAAAVGQGSRAAQVARAALTGSGAGMLEGAVYAAAGGILGGAAPLASEAFANIARIFKRSDIGTIASTFKISRDAAKVIKNTFDQGGDIPAAVANLQRAGSEGMLADAGPAAQALLDAASISGGTAGRTVRDAISERMSRTSASVEETLNQSLGDPAAGPRTAVNEIAARTAPQRERAYGLAYGTPIDYATEQGRKIEAMLSRINRIDPKVLRDAIAEANADMEYRNISNQQIMAQIADDGRVVFTEMPNVQQLDEIKKALGKIAYDQNTDQFGRLTNAGKRYAGLATELRDAISDAVKPYGAAVSIGGDKLAEERAFSLGQELLKAGTRLEDITFELGKFPSQAQIDAAKSGLRLYIDEALGNVRAIASDPSADVLEARQVIKAVTDLSSDKARAKIKKLMGAEADALLSQIDQAAQSATVRAAMAQNSKTAGRQSIDKTVSQLTEPSVVGQALQGEAVNTTKALIQAVTGQTGEYTVARRQRIYNDIAKALTEKRGENALTALRVLDAAMRGQEMTDAQVDSLAKMLAGVLFSGAEAGVARGYAAEQRQAQ
jgi:hypothetical protein